MLLTVSSFLLLDGRRAAFLFSGRNTSGLSREPPEQFDQLEPTPERLFRAVGTTNSTSDRIGAGLELERDVRHGAIMCPDVGGSRWMPPSCLLRTEQPIYTPRITSAHHDR